MANKNPGKLSAQDKAAFLQTSKNLGLHPYEFGGLVQLESGFRPNVWGGAGGNYRGLIQFGPGARQEVGLPSKNMTIAEQLPYVEKYFKQRGYKPGMGIEKAYATVLVGNPGGSLDAKDANQTSVRSAAPRMKVGGDLYGAAQSMLGDVDVPGTTQLQQDTTKQQSNVLQSQQTLPSGQQPINIFITNPTPQKQPTDFLSSYVNSLMNQDSSYKISRPTFDPMSLMSILSETKEYK